MRRGGVCPSAGETARTPGGFSERKLAAYFSIEAEDVVLVDYQDYH